MTHDATKTKAEQTRARQRAEMILKVRGGVLSASEAARALKISRKTYYKWERRGLAAMLAGLCARNSGRPASPCDGEKEELRTKMQKLERSLHLQEEREAIRKQLGAEGEKKSGGPPRGA
jgi:transposase